MAWLRFTADHDHRIPPAPWTRAYRAGGRYSVTTPCRDEALRLNRAVSIATPAAAEAAKLSKDPFWVDDAQRQ